MADRALEKVERSDVSNKQGKAAITVLAVHCEKKWQHERILIGIEFGVMSSSFYHFHTAAIRQSSSIYHFHTAARAKKQRLFLMLQNFNKMVEDF